MTQRNRQAKKENVNEKIKIDKTPEPETVKEPVVPAKKENVNEKIKYKCVACLSPVDEVSIAGKDYFYCNLCGRREEIIKQD